MLDNWKIISKKTAFKNKWRQIDEWKIKLPNGLENEFYFSISNDVAIMVAVTSDQKIILINQYHIYQDQRLLVLPAGYIDDDEENIEAAKRELKEETGYQSDEWVSLGSELAGKWSSNKIHYFLALNAKKTGNQELEPNEDIEVVEKDLTEVRKLLKEHKINNDIHGVVGLYLGLDYLNKL